MSDSITPQASKTKLRLTEIFYSLQGESRTTGIPTVFIRLTGCPLRCQYCDTSYAFAGGEWWEFPAILTELEKYATHYVTVTGGEPLAQKACYNFLSVLCDKGYDVSLETSGAMDVSAVDPRVVKVMDLKTPASGELDKNLYENIQFLNQKDQVKFVLCDRQDYLWAVAQLRKYQLAERCEVLFSPSHGQLGLRDLAEWVLTDQLPVRVQTQLHKLIWGDEPGR
jgi:7-carboxy-7-deazaguanine synthase